MTDNSDGATINQNHNKGFGYSVRCVQDIMLAQATSAALAQDLPKIAVYVTGDINESEQRALGTEMLNALVRSGRFTAVERSAAFVAEIGREQITQRSGAIDDDQISRLGRQFGVQYVCIADVAAAFGSHQVSARILNVETAEIGVIGRASGYLSSMRALEELSASVINGMFERIAPQAQPTQTVTPTPSPAPQQESRPTVHPTPSKTARGYGEAGIGVGLFGFTSIDGQNIKDDMPRNVIDVAVEVGGKFGFRLFGDMPLYGVIELGGIGHRFTDGVNSLQFNSYLIGPGAVFYPISQIQLAASMGYSSAGITEQSRHGTYTFTSYGGFAWNVSAGYEFGSRVHRLLIGIKVSGAHTSLPSTLGSNIPMNSITPCFLVKYVYRGSARNNSTAHSSR
jgi:hypothetical protein